MVLAINRVAAMGRGRNGHFEHTRAELCGGVRALRDEKEELRETTLQQRQRLKELEREGKVLRSQLAEADLLRADVECVNCARKCVDDVALLELDGAEMEKRRLEQELLGFKSGAARLRTSRETDAQRGLERSTWRVECANLEKELASARARLAQLEEDATLQVRASSGLARHQAETGALREDFSMQRRLRSEAEWAWRSAQQELATCREHRRKAGADAGRLEIEKARLVEARSRLAHESEARRRQAEALQASLSELDAMREELQETTSASTRMRVGVERTLQALEQIQRQSSEAQVYAASLRPRMEHPERARAAWT